jgi:capsid protein
MPGYQPRFTWFYDGDMTIDPQKEAKANDTNLKNGSTTHFDVFAEKGQDFRVKFHQIAQAKQLAEKLGIEDVVFETQAQEATEEAPSAEETAEAMAEEGITVS